MAILEGSFFFSRSMILTLWLQQILAALESLKGLFKHKQLFPTPRISNSVDLRWGLQTCIFNKFSSIL